LRKSGYKQGFLGRGEAMKVGDKIKIDFAGKKKQKTVKRKISQLDAGKSKKK
jgi:hypothetical protein